MPAWAICSDVECRFRSPDGLRARSPKQLDGVRLTQERGAPGGCHVRSLLQTFGRPMQNTNVLISRANIAGPALAYWLGEQRQPRVVGRPAGRLGQRVIW